MTSITSKIVVVVVGETLHYGGSVTKIPNIEIIVATIVKKYQCILKIFL